VIGGSSGIGLEMADEHALRAKLILTGRNAERLRHAELELDALTSAAFDATDLDRSSGSSTRCRHRSTT